MTVLDRMRIGPSIRGTPRRRFPGRGLAAVGLLAALAVSQTGCRSAGCNDCGLIRRATSRIFSARIFTRSADCCGDAVIGETFVGDAPAVYESPGVVTPGPSSVVPAPTIEEAPSSLDPLPSAKPEGRGAAGATSGKTGYNGSRPSYRTGQPRTGNNLSQASVDNPAPAARPTRGTSIESRYEANDTLDRLPPLDLPTEVTERSQTPPTPPATKPLDPKPTDAKPAAAGAGAAAPGAPAETSTREPEKPTGSNSSSSPLRLEASAPATAAPGIKRLVAVEIKLAAGSAPTREGLDWLAEKGYKTLLDLREPDAVEPSFIADVAGRGMRYVALPVSVQTLDADHVARFNFEIATAAARPLFFFDSDGARPGALWYVRRVTQDNFNPQLARREAEEIGLTDQAFWVAARDYINRSAAARIGQLPEDADFDPDAAPASAIDDSKPDVPAVKPSASLTTAEPVATVADAGPGLNPVSGSESASGRPGNAPRLDPATARWLVDPSLPFKNRAEWHPIAAVVATGLTVPLAYLTRSILPALVFTKPTASLSAVERRPKSIPDSSGD